MSGSLNNSLACNFFELQGFLDLSIGGIAAILCAGYTCMRPSPYGLLTFSGI